MTQRLEARSRRSDKGNIIFILIMSNVLKKGGILDG